MEPTLQDYLDALTNKNIYESWGDAYKKQFDYAKAKATKGQIESLVRGQTGYDFNTEFQKGLTEANEMYLAPPLEPGFGTWAQRTESPLGAYLPKVPYAPPYTEPPSPVKPQPSLATAFSVQQAIPKPRSKTPLAEDYQINWDEYEKQMQTGDNPLNAEEAKVTTKAIKTSYEKMVEANPNISSQKILDEITLQLRDLGNVGKKVVPLERSAILPSVSPGGTQDPTVRAFSQQVKDIEVPDYNLAQRTFLKSYTDQQVEKEVNANTAKVKNMAIDYVSVPIEYQGKQTRVYVPQEVYEYIQSKPAVISETIYTPEIDEQIRKNTGSSPINLLPNDKKRTSRDAEALAKVQAIKKYDADAWFLDEAKRQAVLADPESFVEQGILESSSVIGGTRETTTGYLLRAALSPLNIVAGTVMDVTSGGDLKEIKQQYRKETQPLYENNPVLANIALNKGFTGEGVEVADALQLEGLPYALVVGGSFAADILDPTLAIYGGAVKGGKAAKTFYGAQKALGAGKDVKGALKVASQTLASEVADDFNVLAPFVPKKYRTPPDLGELLSTNVMKNLETGRALENSKSLEDFANNIGDFNADPVWKAAEAYQRANPNATWTEVVNAVKKQSTGNNTEAYRLVEQYDNRMRTLEAIERNGGDFEAAAKELGQDYDVVFVNNVTKVYGDNWNQYDFITGVKNRLTRTVGKSLFYELAPEAVNLKDVVALTSKTYAHPSQVENILEAAVKSETGQALNDLGVNAKYVIEASEETGRLTPFASKTGFLKPTVQRKLVLDQAQQASAERIINRLTEVGELSPTKAQELLSSVFNGRLAAEDYRLLIDANINGIAKELPGAIKSSDIERLRTRIPIERKPHRGGGVTELKGELLPQAKQLLEPAEARFNRYDPDTLTGYVANKLINSSEWLGGKLSGLIPSKTLKSLNRKPQYIATATLEQQRLINNIQAKCSSLDVQLRRELKSLDDANVRANYGINISDEMWKGLSPLDKLGVAIVGVKKGDGSMFSMLTNLSAQEQVDALTDALDWGIRRLYFKADDVENLTDRASGYSTLFSNRLLNERGNAYFRMEMDKAVEKIIANPLTYWDEFLKLSEKYEELVFSGILGPAKLKAGQLIPPQYESVLLADANIENIKRLSRSDVELIRPELTIGQYYFGKSKEIINAEFQKFVTEDFGDLSAQYKSVWEESRLRDYIPEEKHLNQLLQNGLNYLSQVFYNPNVSISEMKWGLLSNFLSDANYYFGGAILNDRAVAQLYGTSKVAAQFSWESLYKLAAQNNEFKNFVIATQPIIDKMYEDISIIMRRNGVDPNVNSSIDQLKGTYSQLLRDDNMARIYFGSKQYDLLKKQLFEGRTSLITSSIDNILREESVTKKGWQAVRKFLNFSNSLRYTALLGVRPRFHGVNVSTANLLTYQTVGRLVPPDQLANAGKYAFMANAPGDRYYYDIAFTTPTGKSYTYGEINNLVRDLGIRSEFEFITTNVSDETLLADLTKGMPKSKSQAAYDFYKSIEGRLGRFTTAEDLMFRAAIMEQALKEGRSETEAIALARRSMFDYNDMTAFEKELASNYLIFYSFQRQAVASFMKALYDQKQLRRYINMFKLENATEIVMSDLMGTDYKDLIYAPPYMKDNRIATKASIGQEYDWYLTSPPIPAIDSMVMMTDMFRGHFLELARKAVNPNVRFLTGMEDPFAKSNRIPAEYVNALQLMYSSDPNDIKAALETITGGTIDMKSASGEQGGVGGYVYNLNPDQQEAWYQYITKYVWQGYKFLGMETSARDWIKTFGGTEGTSWQNLGLVGQPAASIGLTTPMKAPQPQTVEAAQLRTRASELGRQISKEKAAEKSAKEQLIRQGLDKGENK